MDKTIKLILLVNNERLISEIEVVAATVPGEPDCKLINPMEIWENINLCPWMLDHTKQDIFMISSDKILTLADPMPTLLEKYIGLTK